MIVFDKLFKTMNRKGISQYDLIHKYGVSTGQLDRIRKNQNVTTHTLDIMRDTKMQFKGYCGV